MFDVSQYAWNKVLLIIGSLIGVNISNILWQPSYMKGKTATQVAMLSASIATGIAFTAGGAILEYFGVPTDKVDMVLFTGLCIGLFSPFVLHLWKNFIVKNEDKSIDEVVKDVKGKL